MDLKTIGLSEQWRDFANHLVGMFRVFGDILTRPLGKSFASRHHRW